MRLPLILVLAVILAACAATPVPSDESAYNRGVSAFRIKNYPVAAINWEQAVAEGEPTAANNLAYLLYEGLGVETDRARAVSLWQRAAISGVSEAQWHLGNEYAVDGLLGQDREQAYAWYRCAVENATSQAVGESADVESGIATDARKSLVKLVDRMTPEEFVQGKILAQAYVSKYVFATGPVRLRMESSRK